MKFFRQTSAFLSLLVAITLSSLMSVSAQRFDKEQFFNNESWTSKGDIPQSYNNGIYFDDIDFEEDTFDIYSEFNFGEPGFYDISYYGYKDDISSTSVAYAKGTNYSECSAVFPYLPYPEDYYYVYLRSVGTSDGKVKLGFRGIGGKGIFVNNVKIKKVDRPYELLQGGDITMLHYVLDKGGNYRDIDGNLLYNAEDSRHQKSLAVLKYLAKRGFNVVRIRESVNPGKDSPDETGRYCLPDGYQDKNDCHELALEAKEAGMKIQYTLNLSDYWSNGEAQIVPRKWQAELAQYNTFDEKVKALGEILKNYVRSTLSELKDKGAMPEFVSIGNETNGGILYPYAYSYDVESSFSNSQRPVGKAHPENIAYFTNIAYDVIKRLSPDTKVILHLADNTADQVKWGSPSTVKWYFDQIIRHNVQFDIIGLSYYPAWSEATCRDFMNYAKNVINLYEKDVFIMESGYNFAPKRSDGYDGQLIHNADAYLQAYPYDQFGQKAFVSELLNSAKGVGHITNKAEVVGSLYWDPMMIHVEDKNGSNLTGWAHFTSNGRADVNVVENTTLFDFEGIVCDALDAYEGNKSSHYSPDEENDNTAIPATVSTKIKTVDWTKGNVYNLNGKLVKKFKKGEIYIIDGNKYIY